MKTIFSHGFSAESGSFLERFINIPEGLDWGGLGPKIARKSISLAMIVVFFQKAIFRNFRPKTPILTILSGKWGGFDPFATPVPENRGFGTEKAVFWGSKTPLFWRIWVFGRNPQF